IIAVDDGGRIVDEDLLHTGNQFQSPVLVGGHLQLLKAGVVLLIVIVAITSRIAGIPVAEEILGIAGSHSGGVGGNQIELSSVLECGDGVIVADIQRNADADLLQLEGNGLGKIVEIAAGVGQINQIDVLAVQLPDAVPIGVHDPSLIQGLL